MNTLTPSVDPWTAMDPLERKLREGKLHGQALGAGVAAMFPLLFLGVPLLLAAVVAGLVALAARAVAKARLTKRLRAGLPN